MSDPNDKNSDDSPFTLDPTTTGIAQMPSMTRLLNRKSLVVSKSSEEPSSEPEPPQAPEPTDSVPLEPAAVPAESIALEAAPEPAPEAFELLQLDDAPAAEATAMLSPEELGLPATAPTQAPSAARARRGAGEPLLIWKSPQLKQGKDPLGLGLSMLLEKGASSALFLAASPGETVPVFVAKSQAGDLSKTPIWTGLRWDPKIFPDIWNYFVKAGFIELAPPGTATNQMSARNVIRGAFGVDRSEWLLLVRAGPEKGCRGVLAVVATQSMIPILKPALALIAEKTPTKKAA